MLGNHQKQDTKHVQEPHAPSSLTTQGQYEIPSGN